MKIVLKNPLYLVVSILVVLSLLIPITSYGQTEPLPDSTATSTEEQSNVGAFFANLGITTAQTGVTAALNCTGLDTKLTGLANSATSVGTSVPVSDGEQREELKKQTKKERCLDAIAYSVAKNVLGQVTNTTINWINRGFEQGDPLYLRNQEAYWRSIAHRETEYLINTILQSQSPYVKNIARTVIANREDPLEPLLNYQPPPTQVPTWARWSAYSDPYNRPYTSYLITQDQLNRRIERKQRGVELELLTNRGFLSIRKCADPEGWKPTDTENITLPLTPEQQTHNDAQPEGSTLYYVPTVKQVRVECKRFETQTPGSLIAERLFKVTNSDIDQLTLADEVNESLAAVFDALINQLIGKGLAALSEEESSSDDFLSGSGFGSNSSILPSNNNGQSNWFDFNNTNDPLTLLVNGFPNQAMQNEIDNNLAIGSTGGALITLVDIQSGYVSELERGRDLINGTAQITGILPQLRDLDVLAPWPNAGWEGRLSTLSVGTIPAVTNPGAHIDRVNFDIKNNNLSSAAAVVELTESGANFAQLATIYSDEADIASGHLDTLTQLRDDLLNETQSTTAVSAQLQNLLGDLAGESTWNEVTDDVDQIQEIHDVDIATAGADLVAELGAITNWPNTVTNPHSVYYPNLNPVGFNPWSVTKIQNGIVTINQNVSATFAAISSQLNSAASSEYSANGELYINPYAPVYEQFSY